VNRPRGTPGHFLLAAWDTYSWSMIREIKRRKDRWTTSGIRPSRAVEGCFQGKYADRYHEGANLVLPEHDVAEAFPTNKAVNEALRLVIRPTKFSIVGKRPGSES